jgi:hypothetical protein
VWAVTFRWLWDSVAEPLVVGIHEDGNAAVLGFCTVSDFCGRTTVFLRNPGNTEPLLIFSELTIIYSAFD